MRALKVDEFAAFFKRWFMTAIIGIGGYFITDLHAQYKEHLKDETARASRLVAVETDNKNIDARLKEISAKLDRLIERSR